MKNRIEDLHKRMGHANPEKLIHVVKEGLVDDLQLAGAQKMSFCESCQFGKQSRNPFPKEAVRSKEPLKLIHLGPVPSSRVNSEVNLRFNPWLAKSCSKST